MPNVALIPALAKTLLAIAWADGELHPEEEATLKEVIGLLPAMSAQEWALIELYLVTPIEAGERAELQQHLIQHIRSREDQSIALESVDAMLRADGAVEPAEQAVAHEIREAVAAADVSLVGQLKRTVSGVLQQRPRRETGLALWQSNPVYYLYRTRTTESTDGQVEVAALAAGIMTQVARFTPDRASAIRPVIVEALRRDWGVSTSADQLADAALALMQRHVDFHRISRELARRATEAQRVALLDTLFAVANAADNVAPDEIDEIRIIAERLNLPRQAFIGAKLKIPASERGGL